MSGPPTFTGSRIPGVVPGSLTIIDYSGFVTGWLEAARTVDSNGISSGAGVGLVQTYAVGGDMPLPIESSLEGNPSANYQYVTTTSVQVGTHSIVVANYDISPQGYHETSRILEAAGYLNQIYASLSASIKDDIERLNAIFYTGGEGRSGVDLTRGILTLAKDDMVGKAPYGGYMTLSVADRIVHDAHHLTQYANGDYTGVGDYSTTASQNMGVVLEKAAISATLQAAELLAQLPAAQGTGYGLTVDDLRAYVTPTHPGYSVRQERLRERLIQPYANTGGGGGGTGGTLDNTNN